ncbi:hypothetical protein [Acetobacter orleanensis]|uniref:hypothetical protein n=1 Tax=Acetobacter orleanensis TaxID=104099 RepID=UPI0012E6F3C8|nr:hypothetical protein [Acetobacter orleanensis]
MPNSQPWPIEQRFMSGSHPILTDLLTPELNGSSSGIQHTNAKKTLPIEKTSSSPLSSLLATKTVAPTMLIMLIRLSKKKISIYKNIFYLKFINYRNQR